MRLQRLERIAYLIFGSYILIFALNLKTLSLFDKSHNIDQSEDDIKTEMGQSNGGLKVNGWKNPTVEGSVRDIRDGPKGAVENIKDGEQIRIEERKVAGNSDEEVAKKQESDTTYHNVKDDENKKVVTVNTTDTSTIVIHGRPAGAIVFKKLIIQGNTQKQLNYVFCEGCRINQHENVYCGSKYDYKRQRFKFSMEEAIAEVMKGNLDCGVPAVKLFPVISDRNRTPPLRSRDSTSKIGLKGKWIQDWGYSKRATYINHEELNYWEFTGEDRKPIYRWDSSWKWKDSNSDVSEISLNGICQVCYELGITRLFMVGDSTTQLFYKSLLSLLGLQPVGQDGFDFLTITNYAIPCDQSDTPAEFRGVQLKYMRVLKLNEIVAMGDPSTVVETIKVSEYRNFIESNPNRTAIVFNTGAHLKDLDEYKKGFHLLLEWIDTLNVDDPTKVIGFYRDTVPGHPECKPYGTKEDSSIKENFNKTILETVPYADYDQYRRTTDLMMKKAKQNTSAVEWPWYWYQHANGTFESYNTYSKDVFAKRAQDSFEIHSLNVYNSTILRRDGHEGFGDCLHYRLPGPTDWWVHLFYSVLLDIAGLAQESLEPFTDISI